MKCKWVSALLLMSFPLTVISALTTVTPKSINWPADQSGIGVASFHQGYGRNAGAGGLSQYRDLNTTVLLAGPEPVEGQYNLRWWMMPSNTRRHIVQR